MPELEATPTEHDDGAMVGNPSVDERIPPSTSDFAILFPIGRKQGAVTARNHGQAVR